MMEMDGDKEILPCPFCGGESVCDTTSINGDSYHVSCLTMMCHGNIYMPNFSYHSRETAIEAWNERQ